LVLCLLATASAGAAEDHDRWGPFRGRIIDADSGAPVPGAVIYVIWKEVTLNPSRPYHDGREINATSNVMVFNAVFIDDLP
jgi:hypothetical protein